MKKAVAILFISLVIVLLAMMIWDEKKQEKKTEEKARVYQEKVTPLEEERRKLSVGLMKLVKLLSKYKAS